MKIVLLESLSGDDFSWGANQILDMNDGKANQLIDAGIAKVYDPETYNNIEKTDLESGRVKAHKEERDSMLKELTEEYMTNEKLPWMKAVKKAKEFLGLSSGAGKVKVETDAEGKADDEIGSGEGEESKKDESSTDEASGGEGVSDGENKEGSGSDEEESAKDKEVGEIVKDQ